MLSYPINPSAKVWDMQGLGYLDKLRMDTETFRCKWLSATAAKSSL